MIQRPYPSVATALFCMACASLPAPVRAEDASRDAESSRDVEACQPDIHRLCESFFPDARLVAGCLVDRRADLSTACAEALAKPPADMDDDAN